MNRRRRWLTAAVLVIGITSVGGCGNQSGDAASSVTESKSTGTAPPPAEQPVAAPKSRDTAQPSGTAKSTNSTPPAPSMAAAATFNDPLMPGSAAPPVTELDAVLARGNRLLIEPAAELPQHTNDVHDAMFTAAGRLVCTVCFDGKLKISDAATGALRHEFGFPGYDWKSQGFLQLAATPRKSLVAVARRNEIVLLDAESGKEQRRIKQENDGDYSSLRLTPEGDRLIALRYDKVFVWTLAGNAEPLEFKVPFSLDDRLTLTPDGKSLVRGGKAGEVEFYDLATGKLARTVKTAEKSIGATAIDASGRLLAVGGVGDRFAAVYDLNTGALLGKDETNCSNLAFHGTGLLIVGFDDLELMHIGAKGLRRVAIAFTHRGGACDRMEFSPDGTRALVPGGDEHRGLLYKLSRTQEERVIAATGDEPVGSIALSHDGKRLALNTRTELRLLSWPDGATLTSLRWPQRRNAARVEFSPTMRGSSSPCPAIRSASAF